MPRKEVFNMTDEQIIKALMCLTKDNSSCDDRLHCYFMFKEPLTPRP